MEKMGWQDGKGLGANESGMTENLKIKFKMDTKGVGYNNNDYDNVWLDHQDDFEQILGSLNQHSKSASEERRIEDEQGSLKSLEERSKQSKARVHYKKFTRSKDLSNATTHDLNCILGHKKRKQLSEESGGRGGEEQASEECLSQDESSYRASFKQLGSRDENSSENKSALIFKTNKLSIDDYFKTKMEEKRNSSPKVVEALEQAELKTNRKETKSKEEREEVAAAVGFVEEVLEETKRKKKKKKKSREREEEEIEESVCIDATETTTTSVEVEKGQDEMKFDDLEANINRSFKGSNLASLFGYSSYVINTSVEGALREKARKANKKRAIVEKNLEIDVNFYSMAKKKSVAMPTTTSSAAVVSNC